MPCFHPLHGFRSRAPSAKGKFPIVFNPKYGYSDLPLTVPCGQCKGCRFERSRQWALRCVHEAQTHEHNCFITLTYNDQFLPYDWSLDVSVIQRFMKRLRNRYGSGIRFFQGAEYGDRYGRPHYHVLLFGMDFADKRLHKVEKNGTRLYTSKALSEIWSDPDTGFSYGHAIIGDVTFESAGYVARYCMKKINGPKAQEIGPDGLKHYEFMDPFTGQIFERKPEFATMSRRPGIGKAWFDLYRDDVYPRDFVTHKGKQMLPPRFYDRQYEFTDPSSFERLKTKRKLKAKKHLDDNTPDRLQVKEAVFSARITKLVRGVDHVT